MPFAIPVIKKIFSYLYPVRVRHAHDGQELELLLYRGQYQLGTQDALYSDGTRYRPLVTAFEQLDSALPFINNVLVLGTGLASAVHILHAKGYSPAYTMVEYNKTILQWALELLPDIQDVTPVLADAQEYLERNEQQQYDLVVVDIFIGRVVPAFVTETSFLAKCRQALKPGRHFVLNYIVNDEAEWECAWNNITSVFPSCGVKQQGVNRICIATI